MCIVAKVCNTDMEHQTVTFGVTCVPFSFGGQALVYLRDLLAGSFRVSFLRKGFLKLQCSAVSSAVIGAQTVLQWSQACSVHASTVLGVGRQGRLH